MQLTIFFILNMGILLLFLILPLFYVFMCVRPCIYAELFNCWLSPSILTAFLFIYDMDLTKAGPFVPISGELTIDTQSHPPKTVNQVIQGNS